MHHFIPVHFKHRRRKNTNETENMDPKEKKNEHELTRIHFSVRNIDFFVFFFLLPPTTSTHSLQWFSYYFFILHRLKLFRSFSPRTNSFISIYLDIEQLVLSQHVQAIHCAGKCSVLNETEKNWYCMLPLFCNHRNVNVSTG